MSLTNYGNYYFGVKNAFNLNIIIKLLVKNTIFTKKTNYKLENLKFTNFYSYKLTIIAISHFFQ